MANLKEVLNTLRGNFITEAGDEEACSAFDRALNATLLNLLDGNSAPEPKKRTYKRKKKNEPDTPPAE